MQFFKLISSFLLSVVLTNCLAQSHTDFLQRYWNYRYRLLGDRVDPSYPLWEPGMVIIGEGQPGLSLPASSVEPEASNWHWDFTKTQRLGAMEQKIKP